MKRLLLILSMTMAMPTAFAQPQAGDSYCIGVNPENCPYPWALDDRRWYFDGIPLGIDPQEERGEGREDAPRRQDDSAGPSMPGPRESALTPRLPMAGAAIKGTGSAGAFHHATVFTFRKFASSFYGPVFARFQMQAIVYAGVRPPTS